MTEREMQIVLNSIAQQRNQALDALVSKDLQIADLQEQIKKLMEAVPVTEDAPSH